MSISFFIITKNEEKNIAQCIESFKSISDEIIIVDSMSDDRTVEIAKKYTDRIFTKEFDGYSEQKNFALSKCSNEWVFSIDADERLTEALKEEIIICTTTDTSFNGYTVPRKNIVLDKWIRGGGMYPDRTIRLFKKSFGRFQDRRVHEIVHIEGKLSHLGNPLIHYTCYSLSEFFYRQCHYAKLSAMEMSNNGKYFTHTSIIFKPVFDFLRYYIFRRGFIDGWRGFILAIFYMYYTFLKYAYLWEIEKDMRVQGDL